MVSAIIKKIFVVILKTLEKGAKEGKISGHISICDEGPQKGSD